MFLLFAFLSLFGYTPEQCNDCAWPYYGTANQRGECVIGVGFQADLQNTCYNWCLLWASDVITTVPYVVSSNNSGVCVCQRKASGSSNVEYTTRQRKTCDVVGPSDDVINQMKEYSANQAAINANARQYESIYDQSTSNVFLRPGQTSQTINITMSNGTYGSFQFQNPQLDATTLLARIADVTNQNAWQVHLPNQGMHKATQKMVDTNSAAIRKQINSLDSSLQYSVAKISVLPTSVDLESSFDRLNYAINSRGGSSSSSDPTDLTPVLSSIAAARAANLEATGSVQASVDAMNSNLSSKVDAVADSVSGLGSKLTGMARSIDSGSSARWRLDHDSAALSADALRYSLDSTRKGDGGGWSDDSIGLFNYHVSTNQSSVTDITSEFESMKTLLLGNSCTEFPSWSFEIMGKTHDLGSNFNSWPLIFTLMRFLGRFAGAFMGFKLVFWVVTRPEGGQ